MDINKTENNNAMIELFSHEEFGSLRTTTIDDEIWVVGKDVAKALGYTNERKAIRDHVDSEDKLDIKLLNEQTERIVPPPIMDNNGHRQYPIWINESGFYSLCMSSKLPRAKKFRRWVTSEVLPALRKKGSYGANNTVDIDKLIDAFQNTTNQMVNMVNQMAQMNYNMCQAFSNNCNNNNNANNVNNTHFNSLNPSISSTPLNLRNTAKILGIRPGTFTNWLINNNYVYREKDYNYVCPYDKYTTGDHEYFTTRKWHRGTAYGIQTLVTLFGIQTFTSIFSK